MRSSTKHSSLVELLLSRIHSGELQPGNRLPSEPQLAVDAGVSYMTARKAVSELVEKGFLYRVRGSGTFVAEDPSSGRKATLGLLLLRNWHTVDPFYFPPLVSGFVARAEERGFSVHIADRSEPLIETLKFQELRVRAAACVLIDADDVRDADALLRHGVAIVAINHYGGLRRVTSVSPDNRRGAHAITRSLIELGHRDFIYMNGPAYNLDAIERRKGFEAALKERPEIRRAPVFDVPFSEEAGYDFADRLLKRGKLPTAIVGSSDISALGCLKRLLDAGVQVPKDVSVTGFGDFRLSRYFHPALTTVSIPIAEIGKRAADALVEVHYGAKAETFRLECPVIWRETTAPPRDTSQSGTGRVTV